MPLLRNVETHVRVMAYPEKLGLGSSSVQLRNGERFDGFSRVHNDGGDNKAFFQDTLQKLAESACAGQSHTVLCMGPPSSGRSQTIYNVAGKGVVQLMAEELLRRPDTHVHYTAHHVRHGHVFDSMDERPVALQEMPAPVGPMPLSTVKLLEDPAAAVVVPKAKKVTSSCFVQFHVYHTLQAAPGRKDAFATITFVDVATIDETLSSDVAALEACIAQVGTPGAQPPWNACRLTQLLEASFTGGRTLTAIAAVVGHGAKDAAVSHTLRILSSLRKIEQVATLAQVAPPRFVDHLPHALNNLSGQWKRDSNDAYAAGVQTSYHLIRNALQEKQASLRNVLETRNDDLDLARRKLNAELEERCANLKHQSSDARSDGEELLRDTQRAKERVTHLNQELMGVQERIAEGEATMDELEQDHEATEMHSKLREFEAQRRLHSAAIQQYEQANAQLAADLADAERRPDAVFEMVQRATLQMNYDNACRKLDARAHRYERILEAANDRAKHASDVSRDELVRRSHMSILENAEAKVQIKEASINRVRTSLTPMGERDAAAQRSCTPGRPMPVRSKSGAQPSKSRSRAAGSKSRRDEHVDPHADAFDGVDDSTPPLALF